MGSKAKDVIKVFNTIGECEVYVDKVVEKWNHLWVIYEWRGMDATTYRLVKFIRKDSQIRALKITISQAQAKEIIEQVGLTSENSLFRSSFTWRREVDIEKLWPTNK